MSGFHQSEDGRDSRMEVERGTRSADELMAVFQRLQHGDLPPRRPDSSSLPSPPPAASHKQAPDSCARPPTISVVAPGPASFAPMIRLDRVQAQQDTAPNPFALPPPLPGSASRFDPKTLATLIGETNDDDDDRRRHTIVSDDASDGTRVTIAGSRSTTTSVIDPRSEPGSSRVSGHDAILPELKVWPDIPTAQEYGRPLLPPKYLPRVSRRAPARFPKTLIMPSPLADRPHSHDVVTLPEDFVLGSRPLDPYTRIKTLQAAAREWALQEAVILSLQAQKAQRLDLETPPDRHAGKILGSSLLDQLEHRKRAVKARSRHFAGDNRPAMMTRIHAASRPESMVSTDYGLSEADDRPTSFHPTVNMQDSVFGHDHLWEREMVKLQAHRARQAEERARLVEEERSRDKENVGKRRTWWKGKERDLGERPQSLAVSSKDVKSPTETASAPSMKEGFGTVSLLSDGKETQIPFLELPIISQRTAIRRAREVADWISSDEEDEHNLRKKPVSSTNRVVSSCSSEEDVPLSAYLHARPPTTADLVAGQDGEDDVPLSVYIPNTEMGFTDGSLGVDFGGSAVPPSTITLAQATSGADTQDDTPLGWRLRSVEDDNDVPLGLTLLDADAEFQPYVEIAPTSWPIDYGTAPWPMGLPVPYHPMAVPWMFVGPMSPPYPPRHMMQYS